MMSFSPSNKNSTDKIKTMNALVFMVFVLLFLLSTLVHADHLVEHSINAEQQECYICHQDIDTPEALSAIQVHAIYGYHLKFQKFTSAAFQVSHFILPPLRAPPTFQ